MGVKQVVKKSISAGWNVKGWLGVETIKQNTRLIKDLASTLGSQKETAKAPKKETFAQSIKRLNLTEADIQKRIKASGQIIFLCTVLSIPLLGYTLYMFLEGFYLSTFVCLMMAFLLLAYSFREHFNRFQMRQRRLGCTFKEWFTASFLRKK